MPTQLALNDLDLEQHLRDPRLKQRYVTRVFQIAAASYDRFTRLCSLGMDMAWKRELLSLLKPRLRPEHRILDLATGTGDLAFSLAPSVRRGHVLGLDISENMIERAEQLRRQTKRSNIEFRVGDMMALPLADQSIDAVTVSYGLRNCPDVRGALKEIQRVLRPGGWLASLDFVKPDHWLWERVFRTSLLAACNVLGWLWHREPAVYGYLAHSIADFLSMRELSRFMNETGFQVVAERPKFTGVVCIHLVRKR